MTTNGMLEKQKYDISLKIIDILLNNIPKDDKECAKHIISYATNVIKEITTEVGGLNLKEK